MFNSLFFIGHWAKIAIMLFINLAKFNQNKVLDMKVNSLEDERDIATAAARVLCESFIENARTNTVLYVEHDAIWSKAPDSVPVLIKHLSGRTPNPAPKIAIGGTYKIKKRNLSTSDK